MPDLTLEQAFGQVIRELRHKAGMSQEALSFACGRHRTYVSLIERGKNSPSIRTVWMLAEALGARPAAVIELTQRAQTGGLPSNAQGADPAGS